MLPVIFTHCSQFILLNCVFQLNVAIVRFENMFEVTALGQSFIHSPDVSNKDKIIGLNFKMFCYKIS